ncbi:MAG: Sec-independent protein translocase protein TatB [Pseudorhizobium pelagicum]|uniref:Sec-independent protein translocase protein TatB n=1 Tax=Pseudorhizobium pelagicum TaxID=1509405 RepID=UPI00345FE7B8
MLDIGWTELLVVGIILIVVVGPKDLPPMLRAFGKMTSNLRKMAGEFRSQFDEALRETEMDDVRKTIADVQKLNPSNALRDAINPLRQMGNEIRTDIEKATRVDKPAQASAGDAPQVAKPDVEAQKTVEGVIPAEQPAPVSVPAPAMTLPSTPPSMPVAPSPATADAKPAKAARKSSKPAASVAEPEPAKAAKPKRTRAAATAVAEPAQPKPAPRERPAKQAETPKDEA